MTEDQDLAYSLGVAQTKLLFYKLIVEQLQNLPEYSVERVKLEKLLAIIVGVEEWPEKTD